MMWFIPKNRTAILSLTAGLCLSLGFVAGCKESAPPAKPAVVKKRIEQTPQTTKVTEAQNTAAAGAVPKATQSTPAKPEAATPPAQAAEAGKEKTASASPREATRTEAAAFQETRPGGSASDETSTGTVSLKSSLLEDTVPKYDPTGKIDPFASLFSGESEADSLDDNKPKRPLTPLEKIDISQLQLVAILLAQSGNRAMVEDATGKPYILTTGTYIGINSGTVTKILKDRVVIEEKARDFLGRESTNTRELKLQKPFGEE